MSRLSIAIQLPPEALGPRRRLFERFRETLAERLRRLFPDAETSCRAGASGSIDAAFAPGEEQDADGDRLEAVREEVAAVLEELLVEDDSWWDEEERRKAAAEAEAFPEPFPEPAEARDWSGTDAEPSEGAPMPEPTWEQIMEFAVEPGGKGLLKPAPESPLEPREESLHEAERAAAAPSRRARAAEQSEDAPPLAANAAAPGEPETDRPRRAPTRRKNKAGSDAGLLGRERSGAPRPSRLMDEAAPDVASTAPSEAIRPDRPTRPAAAVAPAPESPEDLLAGGALCRVGRVWAALFPRQGLSVRLEERDGGRVGLVTRLLPGATPSTAAWRRLLGGRARPATWEKAPPEVVAAFLDVIRRESEGRQGG